MIDHKKLFLSKRFIADKILKILERYYYFIFLIYFFIGLFIFRTYGVSTDEDFQRGIGIYWYNYLFDNFLGNFYKYNFYIPGDNTIQTPEAFLFYSAIFDLIVVFLESFLKINDYSYYYLRHFCNFFIFFLSSYFFFKLIEDRFKNRILSIIGALFYILSPRIFADSFYNSKDILFLSVYVISIYQFFLFLRNQDIKNLLVLVIFISLLFSIRPLGILLFFFLILFQITNFLIFKKNYFRNILYILFSFLAFFQFIYILNPFFWGNFFNNFLFLFKFYSDSNWNYTCFYLGDYFSSTNLPWHYIFVWIIITQPFLYVILFFLGFLLIFFRILNRFNKVEKRNFNHSDFWNNNLEQFDILIFLIFISNIYLIIKLNTTIYDGWRHLYFLHFCIVYMIIFSLYFFLFFYKKKRKIIYFIFFFYLSSLIVINYAFHPLQNIYFNFFVREPHKYFDVDYWGLSYKDALRKVLELGQKDKLYVSNASFTPLSRSKELLKSKEKDRIVIIGQDYQKSDFIVTNNYSEVNKNINGKYLIPDNFKLVYEKSIAGIRVYQIFKKNI